MHRLNIIGSSLPQISTNPGKPATKKQPLSTKEGPQTVGLPLISPFNPLSMSESPLTLAQSKRHPLSSNSPKKLTPCPPPHPNTGASGLRSTAHPPQLSPKMVGSVLDLVGQPGVIMSIAATDSTNCVFFLSQGPHQYVIKVDFGNVPEGVWTEGNIAKSYQAMGFSTPLTIPVFHGQSDGVTPEGRMISSLRTALGTLNVSSKLDKNVKLKVKTALENLSKEHCIVMTKVHGMTLNDLCDNPKLRVKLRLKPEFARDLGILEALDIVLGNCDRGAHTKYDGKDWRIPYVSNNNNIMFETNQLAGTLGAMVPIDQSLLSLGLHVGLYDRVLHMDKALEIYTKTVGLHLERLEGGKIGETAREIFNGIPLELRQDYEKAKTVKFTISQITQGLLEGFKKLDQKGDALVASLRETLDFDYKCVKIDVATYGNLSVTITTLAKSLSNLRLCLSKKESKA